MKLNYLIIPAIVSLIAYAIWRLTAIGLAVWYNTFILPPWAPSGVVIGAVYFAIYMMISAAILYMWNRLPRDVRFWMIFGAFAVNIVLCFGWAVAFFILRSPIIALATAAVVAFSMFFLIMILWPRFRSVAYLLLPGAIWQIFALYFTYVIWLLNK